MKPFQLTTTCGAALLITSLGVTAATPNKMPSMEEMWQIIQQQQAEIEAMKSQQQSTSKQVADADEKAEAAIEAIEEAGTTTASAGSWADKTHIGGYGEMHYNNLDSKEEIDFHRFVLYFGHEFTDNIRFFSELELEHALSGDGKNGEIELEQAYVEFDLNDRHSAKTGLFLLPVGILNETHEPPTFYGVERNPVEKNIIPTTWWAGGAELTGEVAPGWSYNFGIHEGLNTSAGNNYAVRKGRQKTSQANADHLAATGRIKWTGMPGVELASTVQYQSDITQGTDSSTDDAWLFEAHADIERGPFGLRALYGRWDLNGSGPRSVGADEQEGFYIEPSYKLTDAVGIFARYNQWDNRAGNNSDTEKKQYDVGVNYWPHPDVVLKADIQRQDNDGDQKNDNGFNLGVGFQF
ncbi:MAG: porin [Pseudomonadota bacterium]